jgi:hypothetical protein
MNYERFWRKLNNNNNNIDKFAWSDWGKSQITCQIYIPLKIFRVTSCCNVSNSAYVLLISNLQTVITTEIMNSRITSNNCPSFGKKSFSASLTNFTAPLSESHDCSCCVSRPILAYPPLRLIYAQTNSRILPICDVSLGSLSLPAQKLETLCNKSCYTPQYGKFMALYSV